MVSSHVLKAVRTLDDIVAMSMDQQRLSLTLILGFALAALLLATLGVYGVVSNTVISRTQELGVRIALGAGSGEIVGTVLKQGLSISVVGVALGLVGAALTARVLDGVVVGVEVGDPIVYGVVAVGLLGVAQLAAFLPARRATRIHPVDALRPG